MEGSIEMIDINLIMESPDALDLIIGNMKMKIYLISEVCTHATKL